MKTHKRIQRFFQRSCFYYGYNKSCWSHFPFGIMNIEYRFTSFCMFDIVVGGHYNFPNITFDRSRFQSNLCHTEIKY